MIVQVSSQTPPTARELLLDAARYLFWEKGYAATGVAELLQRAHVNSGSFYHVFPSKEALLLAVLEDYLGGLEPAVLRPAFARHRDPIERIFAILQGYREKLLATGGQYGCPIGRLALEIEAENIPAHNRIAANFAAWTTAVRACREGVRGRLPLAPRGPPPSAFLGNPTATPCHSIAIWTLWQLSSLPSWKAASCRRARTGAWSHSINLLPSYGVTFNAC